MKQRSFFLILTLAAALFVAAAPSAAAPPAAKQPTTKAAATKSAPRADAKKKQEAKAKLTEITALTKEERALNAGLAKAEDAANAAAEKMRSAEAAMRSLEAEQKPILDQYEKLAKEKAHTERDLKKLMDGLWPVYVRQLVAAGHGLPSWEKADREFVWLSQSYSVTREKLDKAQQQQQELEQALKRKQDAVAKLKKQLLAVNKEKDVLLARKLGLLRSLGEVRKQKKDEETELKEILAVVQDLNYRLPRNIDAAKDEDFGRAKGALPWPIKGRVVQRFNPQAAVARGLGLACEPGGKVRAVHWGKVVHDDVLRGFGRVIILMHDEAYYTLYAFLQKSAVSSGQEVDKGQVLGDAGYYPQANGTGLYFELRFRQKPINPELWLAAH